MPPKKITRKQLLKEPDEFITLSGKLIQFGRAHRNQLSIAAGIFFLALIIISAYGYFKSQSEKRAFGKLNAVMAQYEEVRAEKGAEDAYAAVADELKEIVEAYRSSDAGHIARIVYANYSYNAKQYDQALASYQIIEGELTQNPIYQSLVNSSLGYTYWGKNEPETALTHFNQIIDNPSAPLKDDALFSAAAIYQATDQLPKRLAAFQKIVADHPESLYIEIAAESTGTTP